MRRSKEGGHMFTLSPEVRQEFLALARQLVVGEHSHDTLTLTLENNDSGLVVSTDPNKVVAVETLEVDGVVVYLGLQKDQ